MLGWRFGLSGQGGAGERENLALEQGLAVIGWDELPDLSTLKDRDELLALLEATYPDEKRKRLLNWQSQVWPFVAVMEQGDIVALPLKRRPVIALGRVEGKYEYRPDLPEGAKHTRRVKWLTELPRSAFDSDLRYSFGAFLTVFRVQRNEAEERITAMLTGQPRRQDGLPSGQIEVDPYVDLEQYARDQIHDFIARKFKGHALARLVAGILQAQGYQVQEPPEGPDGGVDIVAGHGPLGFDHPRIVVQVKSSDAPVDVKVVRELQGVMRTFGAEQGLVVAWGGYRQSVHKEAMRHFFEIRLWDSDDLIQALQAHYEKLPDTLQAELPLKRMWALVPGDEN